MKLSFSAFTLIELLITIGISITLMSVSFYTYKNFQNRNLFSGAIEAASQTLNQAEVLARSGQSDSNWGVYFQDNRAITYAGASYSERTQNFDSILNLPAIVFTTAPTDINFQKLSGTPTTSQAVVINSLAGESRTITINEKGLIEF